MPPKSASILLVALLLCTASSRLLASHNRGSQQPPPQCRWIGTITTKVLHETLSGSVIFELESSGGGAFIYKLAGGHLVWSASGTESGCSYSGTESITLLSDSGDSGYLSFSPDSGYDGHVYVPRLTLRPILTQTCGDVVYHTGASIASCDLFDSSAVVDGVISGSYLAMSGGVFIYSSTWDLALTGADTKLTVSSDQYDTWLPQGGRKETDGRNPIFVRAKLTQPDGSDACDRADSLIFELINVSHEKGVALNFPDASRATGNPDLHFGASDPEAILSPDSLTLTIKHRTEALVTIPSFDWGAYGTLKVTAMMHNGTSIVGFLEGHPEITEIPLPRRSNGSKIADKWKEDNGVTALSDDDDSENKPAGDGDVGDGFTLYEEYRGFYENGRHICGDPKKKDLFVYSASDKYLPGIQWFGAVTELMVHYRLNPGEFDKRKRTMNFNHTDGPHQNFDQHGLWVKEGTDESGASFVPELGPPKNVDSVNISPNINYFTTSIRGRRREQTNELNSTVAHELGHAVRIDHHGDLDEKRGWSLHTIPIEGVITAFVLENEATVIDKRWENDMWYRGGSLGENYIGMWGGEHSGVEDCIMRYDVAYAYIPGPGTGSTIRYIIDGNERTGIMLCDKKEDGPGGVNYTGRQPRPRYGNATRGNCKSQICVSDKYH